MSKSVDPNIRVYRADGELVVVNTESIKVLVEKNEDLIFHSEDGHTGALENSLFHELSQMEPGDAVVIYASLE